MQIARKPHTSFTHSAIAPHTNDAKPASSIVPLVTLAGALSLLGVGLATAAHLRRNIRHDIPQMPALDGNLRFAQTSAGQLGYYSAGTAKRGTPPLLLIHSINAAASAYEMKPLYDYYANGDAARKVYALDLPGFGSSDRRNRDYNPTFYRDTLLEFVQQKFKGTPVDIVALSLGCEFVAQAAQKSPQLFRRLVFISPTGLALNQQPQTNEALLRLLQIPTWSRMIYDLLTSRPILAYFLRQSQRNQFNQGLADYAYQTSHQPNAPHAPFQFIAGKLFTPKMTEIYAALTQPTLALFGQDNVSRHEMADELRNLANWRLVEFRQCGGLVHFDDLPGVIIQINRHLK